MKIYEYFIEDIDPVLVGDSGAVTLGDLYGAFFHNLNSFDPDKSHLKYLSAHDMNVSEAVLTQLISHVVNIGHKLDDIGKIPLRKLPITWHAWLSNLMENVPTNFHEIVIQKMNNMRDEYSSKEIDQWYFDQVLPLLNAVSDQFEFIVDAINDFYSKYNQTIH